MPGKRILFTVASIFQHGVGHVDSGRDRKIIKSGRTMSDSVTRALAASFLLIVCCLFWPAPGRADDAGRHSVRTDARPSRSGHGDHGAVEGRLS